MYEEITYTVTKDNQHNFGGWGRSYWDRPTWSRLSASQFCPDADNYDLIQEVILPGYLSSENIYDMSDDEARRRWIRLSFGNKAPDGMPIRTAVIFAEAIWLSWLSTKIGAHPYLMLTQFVRSLTDSPFRASQLMPSWSELFYQAMEAGVDYQIEAFCAGVPIEYIIQDVKSV